MVKVASLEASGAPMWTRGNILGMFPAAVLQFYRLGFGLFHGAPCAKGGCSSHLPSRADGNGVQSLTWVVLSLLVTTLLLTGSPGFARSFI